MKLFAILFISSLIMVSCKQKSNADQGPTLPKDATVETYEAEILKIHDEAMPMMSELNQLETQVRNIRIEASKSDEGSSALPDGIDDVLQSLKTSQNAMLDWMEYYSAMRTKLEQDVMMSFMQAELQKVAVVKKKMEESISKAKVWIAAHPS
jgi:hypothetical protein